MHNDNKKSTAYLVLTGVLASQFVVNESVGYAQGFLTNSEILLNKEGANSNETTNNLDYNAVEKVDLSKELEKDENTETEQKLTYEYIDESSIRAPKEELDSKELAKRLIIPIFSFASVGAATGIINHLVDSKNEQQNKKEDDPIPGPNQENNTIPTQNQENNTIPRTNQENNTIPRTNQENNTIPRLNQENNTIPRQNQENNTIPRTNQENNTIPGPNQENNTIPRTNQENNTIPMQNQENNTIPRPNQEDDPGNNFLKIIIYTVLTVILLWLFGKFVIAPLAVLRVRSEKGLSWLNLLTKLKVRPKKVEFIINEIDDDGNPPAFIIEAAKKNLIRHGDKVKTPNDKFGEFVIEKLKVLEVRGEKELSMLNLLTKLKVRPEKVEFIINEKEIHEEGNPPDFIIEADKKNLISPVDKVKIPEDLLVKCFEKTQVYGNGGLFWLKWLTERNVRPKKVEFIIDEIDENGNPPAFIIEAAQNNLISPGDEVIISESKKYLEKECANKILDNCDYKIFLFDPEATFNAEADSPGWEYTGVLKVVSVSGFSKYYIDMAKKFNTNSLDGFKEFSFKLSISSNVFFGNNTKINEKIFGIRIAIHIIIQPSKGDIINMTWTRNERTTCEDALRFLEKEEMKIKIDYLKSRIDATKLYRSILLKAGFGIKEDADVFEPNKKSDPGGVEVFQMLICMEKLLNGKNWEEFDLPAYKSLLIEFYYYSITNPENIKDEAKRGNNEWDEKVFEKVKELEGIGENLNEEGLLEKIRNLKEFLQEINSEIKADELNGKVYGSIQNNYQ